MKYKIDTHNCWQAQDGKVVMGCCLDPSGLEKTVSPRFVKQVHGSTVVDDSLDRESVEADGLVTDQRGRALCIKTADCVPLHLSDGRRIALLHAGWRGTAAGIVKTAEHYFDLAMTQVVIGPSISALHYEVDKDLYAPWLRREPALQPFLLPAPSGGDKRLFDLRGFIAAQLLEMGLPEAALTKIPLCTYATSLPSYRRQGKAAARIINYIYRL